MLSDEIGLGNIGVMSDSTWKHLTYCWLCWLGQKILCSLGYCQNPKYIFKCGLCAGGDDRADARHRLRLANLCTSW